MRRSLLLIAAVLLVLAPGARADDLTGAGSTFAYPIIWKWSEAFRAATGTDVAYQSVGSSAGVNRIRAKTVDFGASDKPLKPEDLDRLGLGQFPIVFGGVVPVVNLAGVAPGTMRFTGAVLADIYMGKITRWSDPALKALNPDLDLPDTLIAVIHRSDGSGTTFNWVSYLAKASADWKRELGEGSSVAWPVGSGARGNEGVALEVKRTPNAIGYVEFTYVTQAGLTYGLVQNRAGRFIAPSAASFQAAALGVDWAQTRDFYATINDSAVPEAYPIAATTFVLLYKAPADGAANRTALDFFDFALGEGSDYASQLGYVPLPAPLVQQVRTYWAATFKSGSGAANRRAAMQGQANLGQAILGQAGGVRRLLSDDAVAMFDALAQPTRFDAFRLLLRYAPFGLNAGDVARLLAVPHNTMSTHLAHLERAGLVASRREGRSIIYTATAGKAAEVMELLLGELPALADAGAAFPRLRPGEAAERRYNVLLVCSHNSARSIMAEAVLNREGGGRFHAFSAGSVPRGAPHKLALELLRNLGYTTDDLRSKSWDEFAGRAAEPMDFVITVCDAAAGESCPVFPGHPLSAHWGLADPAAGAGTEAELRAAFVRSYRQIAARMSAFVNLPLESLDLASLKARLGAIAIMDGATEMTLAARAAA